MKLKTIGVVAVLIAVFLVGDVFADQSYPGTFKSSEKIEGVYFYKIKGDVEFHSQATIYRKSTDNNFVYCIESGVPLGGAKAGEHADIGSRHPGNSSKEDILEVEALAYYGYGYKDEKYDHTDPIWYAITQYLIWLVEDKDMEHFFVSSLTSTTPIYPFQDEINELTSLVKNHTTSVNLDGSRKLMVNSRESFKDLNGVLEHYEYFTSDNLNVLYFKDNILTVVATEIGNSSLDLVQNYNNYGKRPTYYESGKYQNMLSPGDLEARKQTILFNANGDVIEEPTIEDNEEENTEDDLDNPNDEGDTDGSEDGDDDFEIVIPDNSEDEEKTELPDVLLKEDEMKLPEVLDKEDKIETPEIPDSILGATIPKEEGKEELPDEPKDDGKEEQTDEPKEQEKVELPDDKDSVIIDKIEIVIPEFSDVDEIENEKTNDTDNLVTLEKDVLDNELNNNLNSEYIPVEVELPATDLNALSLIFYLTSMIGLCFIKYAK